MEQMRQIKRELGMESDGKEKLIEKFTAKAAKLAMPEGVRKVFDEEMSKLVGLDANGSEFNVTRNYLDWLTQLPWGLRSAETFAINHAREVLDEDHHGLKDVKDRILEFIAVGKLRGTVEGKILCLVGPLQCRWYVRCCRDQGPPKDVCWCTTRSHHPGAQEVPDGEPSRVDRRSRQDGSYEQPR
jgi:ATP-dependent Lon protease